MYRRLDIDIHICIFPFVLAFLMSYRHWNSYFNVVSSTVYWIKIILYSQDGKDLQTCGFKDI
jgi:hypothetical protein